MPHFMQKTVQGRLLVSGAILTSSARREALKAAGAPIPGPQRVVALLDTGASISAVDPSVLKALSLEPTGAADVHTPSTGGTPMAIPTYDVTVGIFAARLGDLHFLTGTVRVIASDLNAQGIQALIGTDILRSCILTYNGADECFTLAW